MKDLFFDFIISSQVIYMSVILFVIGNAVQEITFIKDSFVVLIILSISMIVELVSGGINLVSIFSSIISISLSMLLHKIYVQTKILIAEYKMRLRKPDIKLD